VSSISGQGGWPLTASLTPEGKPYFGGTYFPPDDRHGRAGSAAGAATMAEAFEKRRDEVNESAGSVLNAIEHTSRSWAERKPWAGAGGEAGARVLKQFDARAAVWIAAEVSALGRDRSAAGLGFAGIDRRGTAVRERYGEAGALVTLTRCRRAGSTTTCGGFHRYSVDDQVGGAALREDGIRQQRAVERTTSMRTRRLSSRRMQGWRERLSVDDEC